MVLVVVSVGCKGGDGGDDDDGGGGGGGDYGQGRGGRTADATERRTVVTKQMD